MEGHMLIVILLWNLPPELVQNLNFFSFVNFRDWKQANNKNFH